MSPEILYTIVGVVIAGIFAGLLKLIPAIIKAAQKQKDDGPDKNETIKMLNSRPGRAQVCIDRAEKHGELLVRHEETLKTLEKESEESKKDRTEIKEKISVGFKGVHERLDRFIEKR